VGGVGGLAAILTAVLVYFGRVRAAATYNYFGVDVNALNFSVSDYLLRSVNVAFPMVIVIALFAAAATFAHEQIRPALDDADRRTHVVRRAAQVGAVTAAAGLILALILAVTSQFAFLGLVMLVVGAVLGLYAMIIRSNYPKPSARTPTYLIAAVALVLLLFIWAVIAYANYAGVRTAERTQAGLPKAADVIVYSATSLSITGPGVTISNVQDSEFKFRYAGLRFLAGAGGNDFLLPEYWRPGDGDVIVLPAAGPGMMIEFAAP
jgi:hypothetical protein